MTTIHHVFSSKFKVHGYITGCRQHQRSSCIWHRKIDENTISIGLCVAAMTPFGYIWESAPLNLHVVTVFIRAGIFLVSPPVMARIVRFLHCRDFLNERVCVIHDFLDNYSSSGISCHAFILQRHSPNVVDVNRKGTLAVCPTGVAEILSPAAFFGIGVPLRLSMESRLSLSIRGTVISFTIITITPKDYQRLASYSANLIFSM